MWKEYNRRNKNIKRRWRSRYKSHNRAGAHKMKMIVLLVMLVALLVGLVIYAGSCIRDLAGQEQESVVNMNTIDSVQITPTPSPIPTPEPQIPCVILDAGHGGMDGGTYNGDIIEKDINLGIVQYIKEILEENEIKVVLTRTQDELIELQERTAAANEAEGDLFVSIHCNYYEDDAAVYGLECYSCPGQEESADFSNTIISAMKKMEEVKVRSAREAEYYVLKYTNMPAVLVEVGFLSNKAESEKLNTPEYQQTLAQGIADAVLEKIEQMTENEKEDAAGSAVDGISR